MDRLRITDFGCTLIWYYLLAVGLQLTYLFVTSFMCSRRFGVSSRCIIKRPSSDGQKIIGSQYLINSENRVIKRRLINISFFNVNTEIMSYTVKNCFNKTLFFNTRFILTVLQYQCSCQTPRPVKSSFPHKQNLQRP